MGNDRFTEHAQSLLGCEKLSHLSRYIKKSIFIMVNNPTLYNNVGKFNLPHIWDRL